MTKKKKESAPFPLEWASAWGQDGYGRWMAFEFHGVRQVLRWIPPGRFMMGSPEDEVEREEDEKQHEVILTEGFWLAETACTQELWQAVMRKNPRNFQGEQRPVDSVSWDDCMRFLERVNDLVPGLELRLPTEAEWEYACRAGTTTPFSFGVNILPEQVNYRGTSPYADGKKGLFRQKTVKVKSLPVNPWGLYEMHGNVWEWCNDLYGAYFEKKSIDPKGPDSGEDRVLRGGSWFNSGRLVRSAFRLGYSPSYRDDYIGFRLARGQKASQQEAGAGPDSQPRSG